MNTQQLILSGMIRLPNAFKPLIQGNLKYHRKIQKIEYFDSEKKVQVSWKNNYTDRQFGNATYDYAFVSVPFTVVRKWELPGKLHRQCLSSLLNPSNRVLSHPSKCYL
jgi:monoamine oxidase